MSQSQSISTPPGLTEAIALGEGQTIEFKEAPSKLDKEIVAFANANGGVIFCGVDDSGKVVGTSVANSVRSEIQNIARNCDPQIQIKIEVLSGDVLRVEVPEGKSKPYQCSSGFFMRMGANAQKLKASEIKSLLRSNERFYDSEVCGDALVKKHLSIHAYSSFVSAATISNKLSKEQILVSLGTAAKETASGELYLTNAGVLLFSDSPKSFIPESYLTAVRYKGTDRFNIIDRKDFTGSLIDQIEGGLAFAKTHISTEYEITGEGRRNEVLAYPLVALREALINAVVHKDYTFQNSSVYLHIYSDRLEIDNPGGLCRGQSVTELEGYSVRRNPLLADLLYRAGYGEKLGSGLQRIRESLHDNSNPPYSIAATNFFSIRFFPRVHTAHHSDLTERQLSIIELLSRGGLLTSTNLATRLSVSTTSIIRDLELLITNKLVTSVSRGRGTKYKATHL